MNRAHLAGLAGVALIAAGITLNHAAPIGIGFVFIVIAALLERDPTPDTDAADDARDAERTEYLQWLERRDLEALADRQHALDLRYWSDKHGGNSREHVEAQS